MSNTHFMVEALLAGGLSKDDPAIKNALIYISRSQNLKSEFNDQPFAAKATDAMEQIVRDDSSHGMELSQPAAPVKGRLTAPLGCAWHESYAVKRLPPPAGRLEW